MTEQNNHTTDAPDGWERYGQMLRTQPPPTLPEERVTAMMARLNTSIDRPSSSFSLRLSRLRMPRWVLAPAIGMVALLVLLMVNILGPSDDAEQNARRSSVSAPASSEAPRQTRRFHRRSLQAPEVTDAPAPVSVDSALPSVQFPPTYADSAVPDTHSAPSPGPHSSGPSPGPRR